MELTINLEPSLYASAEQLEEWKAYFQTKRFTLGECFHGYRKDAGTDVYTLELHLHEPERRDQLPPVVSRQLQYLVRKYWNADSVEVVLFPDGREGHPLLGYQVKYNICNSMGKAEGVAIDGYYDFDDSTLGAEITDFVHNHKIVEVTYEYNTFDELEAELRHRRERMRMIAAFEVGGF